MKVPVPCMSCNTYSMEMDMTLDHQHVTCGNCGATWCLQCKEVKVDPQWLMQQQAASKAELN